MIVILEEKDFYPDKNRTPRERNVVFVADIVIDMPKRKIIKTRFDTDTTIQKLQEFEKEFKGMDVSYVLHKASFDSNQ